MEGENPGSGTPLGAPQPTSAPRAERADRGTTGVREPDGSGEPPRQPWVPGRLALIVAGLGLLGASLGGAWLGLAEPFGYNPGGVAGLVMVVSAAALLIVGLLLALGGVGFYVLAPAFMGARMAWHGVGSHRLAILTTLTVVPLAYLVPVIYAAIAGAGWLCSGTGFVGLLVSALSVNAALLGVTYLRFIRPGIVTPQTLGLDPSRLVHHIGLGLVLGVGILVVNAALQASMQAFGVRQTQLAGLQCVRDFPLAGYLLVLVAIGPLTGIAEELYFRGFMFQTYLRMRGPVVAYVATSILFALMHLNGPAFLPILALSLILCFAYQRTGSIVPSMVAHAVNNTTAFVILYATTTPLGTG